ncbi:polyadenylate-binding protein-interacting protein 11-like [Miscanthus floridulus]|uniref:polyadenylate-binding protein-interacting protein 11-like n=1 Tax=Miscanthus floridulus TaxID=154761 RepID=UPI003458CBC1
MLGVVPERYSLTGGDIGFDTYFSMARGNATVLAMEMTKWFNTNYHFIIPELGPNTKFSYASHKVVNEYKEAKAKLGCTSRYLIGVTFWKPVIMILPDQIGCKETCSGANFSFVVQVTEENLAGLFINCRQVVDCRMCGDPNSVLRFAFIEFTDEGNIYISNHISGAKSALNLSGTMLGYYPVRVLPSKTAIASVNPTFLPRSDNEREMCARTIYCTNIDKKVTQADLKLFFETICGEVFRLRLLGDYHHSTRIAFVEFVMLPVAEL